jgi:hypothetical protein
MFDNDAGGFFEGIHAFERCVSVGDIVEGQFLALDLAGGGDAPGIGVCLRVECRLLMGVLAVA